MRNKMLRRQNEVLRKKIKQVTGSEGIWCSEHLNVEIENQFLRNVLAFEDQWKKNRKQIQVIDRIGTLADLRPLDSIPQHEIEREWVKLKAFMNKRGIDLDACNPDVGARELYRFATEELFKMKIDDISIPGMMTCFIYEEFYPQES